MVIIREMISTEKDSRGDDSPDPTRLEPEQRAELKKDEANRLYGAAKYKEALVIYNEIIFWCPNVPKYYGNRCACFMMLSQYKDAVKDAKRCLELDPKFVKAAVRLVKCSLMIGDVDETEKAVSKLEALDPSKESIKTEMNNLSELKKLFLESETAILEKNYTKVVDTMNKICKISPFCAKFKITKAEYLLLVGSYKAATKQANDVLSTEKKNVDAYYIRAVAFYYEDSMKEAFTEFDRILRLAPDHQKTVETYKRAKLLKTKKEEGNAAFKAEKYQEAYDIYTAALLIDPQNRHVNAKLHFNKATAAAKLKKIRESIDECSEALKLVTTYVKAVLRKAACHMELEEFDQAVREYERACQLNGCEAIRRLMNEAKKALKLSKQKNYYSILGISIKASIDEVKKAYYKKAKTHHPDRHAHATEEEKKVLEKRFKEIGEAYSTLSDPRKKFCYDNGLDVVDEPESDGNYASKKKKQHNSSTNKQRKKDTPRKAGSDSSENKKKEDVCWYHEKFGDRCRPDKCRPPCNYKKK